MKKVYLVLFFCVGMLTSAQDYRFGKVDSDDFKRLTPVEEEEPVAEVLYRKEHISFRYVQGQGFVQYRDVHERVKINKEEGLEYATKKVRLYNPNATKRERLKKLSGYTFVLENGEVRKEKLRGSGEFEEQLNEYWKQSSFTMPDAQIGSIIEYKYSIVSPFFAIDDVIIQYDIPIRKIDLQIKMLEYITYGVFFNPRGSYQPDLSRSVSREKISSKLAQGLGMVQESAATSRRYELSNQVLSINTENVPALEHEPMTGSMENYRSKIKFELSEVHFPNQNVEKLSSSWSSVAKSIFENKKFGGQIDKSSFYKKDLEGLLTGITNPLEKVKTIYDLVKDKVKWNGYYGIYTQKGIKDAYKDGAGNVSDINLLLVSMLQSQGIEALPMLISSQNNGVPLFPTRDGFDYVAALVMLNNDEQLLLDATDDNLAMGSLPYRASNWMGRAITKNGDSFSISLMPDTKSKEMVMNNLTLHEDLTVTGKSINRLTDYLAHTFRDKQISRDINDVESSLESDRIGVEISKLKLINARKPMKPMEYNYDIELQNNAELIGDKIYFSPLFNEGRLENPFKAEQRNLPVVLKYPVSRKVIVNLTIPEGYEVASLPESVQIMYNENIGIYKYLVSHTANKITVNADFEMNESYVIPKDYEMWKKFYTAMVAKDSEKVVLKKI